MKSYSFPAGICAGIVLALLVSATLSPAQGDPEDEARAARRGDTPAALAAKVRSALGGTDATAEFRLLVVANEHGSYIETFGNLEDEEDAHALARRLFGLAEMFAHGEEEEEEEHEHEEEHDEHEHDDDDDEDDHEDDDE